jgi:periplasmic protein CpxP/Spy
MRTRNKIISGLVLSTVLVSGLFAGNDEMRNNKCMMKKDSMHMDKKHGEKSMLPIMFKQLSLTQEQETKIEKIIVDSRENMETFDEAFTKDSFDKNKYIKIMAEKRDNMLKSQAEVLEKSYAILTPKQKEQLKVLMDLRKEKMNKKL